MKNPANEKKARYRVRRGAGWSLPMVKREARVSNRGSVTPTDRYSNLGFRIVRNAS